MATQKDIAADLDLASKMAGEFGASRKQVWFLAGLIAKAGEEASGVIEGGLLSSRNASFYINHYLREERLVATGLTRQQARMKMMGVQNP